MLPIYFLYHWYLLICTMFSKAGRIFIFDKWYETHSIALVRWAFRRHDMQYHGKNLPSRRSIERVLEKFRSNGTINDLRFNYSAHKGRDLNLTPAKIERVKTLYKRKQKLSIRRAARLSNVSRYFVTKILKKCWKEGIDRK